MGHTGVLLTAVVLVGADVAAVVADYAFVVRGEKTYLNGRPFLAKGLRCWNGLLRTGPYTPPEKR